MDVRPVGGGPTGTDLTQGTGPVARPANVDAPGRAGPAQAAPSIDGAILSALSEPDLARLMAILEPPQTPGNATRVSELVHAVMTSAAAGDIERTLQEVTQLAVLDPLRAEAVRTEPGLEPLRPQVDSLLTRLANVTKLDAQSRLAEATQILAANRSSVLPDWDTHPDALLTIASRLLDAGGYINSLHAAQVAQVVVDGSRWAPAGMVPITLAADSHASVEGGTAEGVILPALRQSWAALAGQAPSRIAGLWRRAPLLLLLVAWLAVGTAGGLASLLQRKVWPDAWPSWLNDAGFTLWALGFPALVLFGFYMRVRNVRL